MMRVHSKKNIVLLCIHGGGWVGGSPSNKNFNNIEKFSEVGMDVVCPTYRLATPERPSFGGVLWDIQKEVQKARTAYNADEVVVLGTSAGANLAMLSSAFYKALDGRRVADKLVLMYGFYDFNRRGDLHPDVDAMFSQAIGTIDPSALNPMNHKYISELVDIPTWIYHGENDHLIDIQQSYSLVDGLTDLGGSATLVVDQMGHGVQVTKHFKDIVDFIAS